MGRSTTPRYAVTVTFASGKGLVGAMAYDAKRFPATDAGLAAYVACLDASMAPGGANAHLGPDRVTSAKVRRNVADGATVATY